ncbi:alginate export family protein [Xanthomonas sp. AmX2]|uniref:alginate export family protein n=1 Tax=Xanthomonas sp. TaxID=29446 RepID=UPI00197D695C|nr:alginate export family protein [Xanthomonas sp.]MBN6150530.1 alginate export family protein [Xanthomonas sp.]
MPCRSDARAARKAAAVLLGVLPFAGSTCALAEDAASPARPALGTNRWQEDWSALADPALRSQALDRLKYLSLPDGAAQRYASFGLNLRERFESNDAPGLGAGGSGADAYLLQRLQLHADLRLAAHWQAFAQLEDVRAYAKRARSGADQNRLDLRLAFVAYSRRFDAGTFKARVGRQDFAFDLQRFVSSRDGPNVRQSFDAVWADWETGTWRFIGFVSQPVQYADGETFDDASSGRVRFGTLRAERHVLGDNELSGYYARYERDQARYADGSGRERRHVFDLRFAGQAGAWDWDLETMAQRGSVGAQQIRAWALGARGGHAWTAAPWQPRLGLQLDAASGDARAGDRTLGTFNPLFPNGYYFSLAGYTGYSNLIHVKPSLRVAWDDSTEVTLALGLLWRQTTADAVYAQPNVAIAGTAGQGGRRSGRYAQLRVDKAFSPQLDGALEAVRYQVGDALRTAGAHDSDYLGIEMKYGW